ncbi:hypothetical protein TWF730_010479 [Orbilia blumenaviensis]|uniref:Uncharacterized protein n=1 Tax=Orbilia blumenaviensis TaxID=1796055 RepID=A0AAV9URU4_9PEZI
MLGLIINQIIFPFAVETVLTVARVSTAVSSVFRSDGTQFYRPIPGDWPLDSDEFLELAVSSPLPFCWDEEDELLAIDVAEVIVVVAAGVEEGVTGVTEGLGEEVTEVLGQEVSEEVQEVSTEVVHDEPSQVQEAYEELAQAQGVHKESAEEEAHEEFSQAQSVHEELSKVQEEVREEFQTQGVHGESEGETQEELSQAENVHEELPKVNEEVHEEPFQTQGVHNESEGEAHEELSQDQEVHEGPTGPEEEFGSWATKQDGDDTSSSSSEGPDRDMANHVEDWGRQAGLKCLPPVAEAIRNGVQKNLNKRAKRGSGQPTTTKAAPEFFLHGKKVRNLPPQLDPKLRKRGLVRGWQPKGRPPSDMDIEEFLMMRGGRKADPVESWVGDQDQQVKLYVDPDCRDPTPATVGVGIRTGSPVRRGGVRLVTPSPPPPPPRSPTPAPDRLVSPAPVPAPVSAPIPAPIPAPVPVPLPAPAPTAPASRIPGRGLPFLPPGLEGSIMQRFADRRMMGPSGQLLVPSMTRSERVEGVIRALRAFRARDEAFRQDEWFEQVLQYDPLGPGGFA